MATLIDADTHIAEPAQMWDHIPEEMYPRRPVMVRLPEDTLYQKFDATWLIDGNIFPKGAGKGGTIFVTPSEQRFVQEMSDVPARELNDLGARFQDMQHIGTDVQVVYPTLFLTFLTHDPKLEIALCQAYNRHLAQVSAAAEGWLRWVLIPPLQTIDAAIQEIRYGKEHGAVGVFFRGIEKDRTLDDPYFFPIYEEAASLDLAICIHQGSGCPDWTKLMDLERSSTFTHGRLPPLVAFRNIVANKIPEQFPTLRFGFIETGASWVPYVLHQLRGDYGPKLFEDYRIWVSYEVAEDLPYLAHYIGEDHLVVGSDYAHHGREGTIADPSAQLHYVTTMRSRDYPPSLVEKMLAANPQALYGI
jgi:predicted TIM-barrel fold metal-dependent hydrolase